MEALNSSGYASEIGYTIQIVFNLLGSYNILIDHLSLELGPILNIDAKIKLYIVCTPYMIEAKGIDKSIILGKSIAQQFTIPFLDYSRDTFYTSQPSLFADYRHLNRNGVKFFSNTIVDIIKRRG